MKGFIFDLAIILFAITLIHEQPFYYNSRDNLSFTIGESTKTNLKNQFANAEITVIPVFNPEVMKWNVNVNINGDLYLNQLSVPGINENNGFYSKRDAFQTGNLIARKIKNNQYPFISKYELDSMRILY